MKKVMGIGVVILFLMCVGLSGEALSSECCPSPPTCIPTLACPLEMAGGQTAQATNKVIQEVSTVYESVSQAYRKVTKTISKTRKAIVSAVDSVKDAVSDAARWPLEYVGEQADLLKEEEEDKEGVTQDNSHSDTTKVSERIAKNLETYEEETKSDYASEYFTVERRRYIRQQATITLMARMLTIKAKLKDLKELVDEVAGDVEKSEEQASAASDGSMDTAKNNETVILKANQQLRLIWFKLLAYQRTIEAIKLEFAANQSISGMKIVKKVPEIQSSGSDGGGTIKTAGDK